MTTLNPLRIPDEPQLDPHERLVIAAINGDLSANSFRKLSEKLRQLREQNPNYTAGGIQIDNSKE